MESRHLPSNVFHLLRYYFLKSNQKNSLAGVNEVLK